MIDTYNYVTLCIMICCQIAILLLCNVHIYIYIYIYIYIFVLCYITGNKEFN